MQTLQKKLKEDLVLQIMNQTYYYLEEKNEKLIGLMKDELGEKIMKEFAALRLLKYSYLTGNNDEDKA